MNRNRTPRTTAAREALRAEIELEREIAARRERAEISASTARHEERQWAHAPLAPDYDYVA